MVASGARSRVVRLLRDARAAVQDPIRPETPLETFKASGGPSGGIAAGTSFPQQPAHGIESRLRRRLPAGGRLAPMPPSSAGAAASTTSPLLSSVSTTVPVTGLSSEIDPRAHQHRSDENGGSFRAAAADTSNTRAAPPSAIDARFDADEFARRYTAAQQRGEEGLLDCLHLLGQLREWLSSSPSSTSPTAPRAIGAAATACLQATLLHFCEYWPSGDALRNAVQNYSAVNGDGGGSGAGAGVAAVVASADGRRGSRSVSSSVPLNYAEVALVAAAVMVRSYPAASLLAEPISVHALLSSLHTIAECGVAEWVTQETGALEALMELLRALAAKAGTAAAASSVAIADTAQQRERQWLLWILEIFAGCCEEALLSSAAAAAAATTITTASTNKKSGSVPSRLRVDGSGVREQDMIRGQGFADDVVDVSSRSQQRAASASMLSSSASLNRVMQPQLDLAGSYGSFAGGGAAVPQGSPLRVVRHGSGGSGEASLRQPPFTNALEAITLQLVSLGLLTCLHDVSAQTLQRLASAPPSASTGTASSSPIVLLPVICSLFRLFAPYHADALRAGGVVNTLVSVLRVASSDSAAVESAARALVKLSFNDACLSVMQETGVVLMDAVAHALLAQLRQHANGTPTAAAAAASPSSSSIELLVSRLCGVVARVAEGRAELQEHLATPAVTHVLEMLAQRYLTVKDADVSHVEASSQQKALSSLSPTPLLQSIVWVLGIAAMSPKCSLHLVECVTPLLVNLLQHLREVPSMHTTAVYVLMCLSNLSYFFNRFEGDGAAAAVADGGAEWLSMICGSLGFSLAAYLFEDNVEATVEATRILGNISYTNAGRDWMEANHCDEVIVLFLGHEDLRIMYNCCGVLLNLTAASPCRVVDDPELLKMMLSYTARYTRDDSIAVAAALEKERLRTQRRLNGTAAGGEDEEGDCAAEASSSADQIADLVEKLLHNVRGLLTFASSATGSGGV